MKNAIVQINTLNTLSSQYWHLKTIVAILIIVTVWALGVLSPFYASVSLLYPWHFRRVQKWNSDLKLINYLPFPVLITFQNKTYIIINEINDVKNCRRLITNLIMEFFQIKPKSQTFFCFSTRIQNGKATYHVGRGLPRCRHISGDFFPNKVAFVQGKLFKLLQSPTSSFVSIMQSTVYHQTNSAPNLNI